MSIHASPSSKRQRPGKKEILHDDGPPAACRRCGECCRKGGPALHRDDIPLVVSGRVPRAALITLRRGETVLDNVSGRLETLGTEMVRVGPTGTGPSCPFFREPGECLIHDRSPAECRTLFCEAPQGLMAMYRLDRIERTDLIPAASPARELVAAHEARCPAGEAVRLALAARGDAAAAADLSEMLRFDAAFRELCLEKAALPADELAFYFGRPLSLVVQPFVRGRAPKRPDGDAP
jgi:Fe-S-cluster containining protein